jgi:uncharacterized protein (TIGR03437 family)
MVWRLGADSLRYDMDTPVCHRNTIRFLVLNAVLTVVSAAIGSAQTAAAQTVASTWRKLGGSAVETGLAGAVGGIVPQVWFSEDGAQLFARTARGVAFVTADFDTWTAAPLDAARRELPLQRAPVTLPEAGMNIREGGGGRLYAFGTHVYASENGGRTWINLTAFNGRSVIGDGQRDLAVSPRDPLFVAVGNSAGVWASHDGGLSWSGLNEGLPNLSVRALLPRNEVLVEGLGTAGLNGRAGWLLRDGDATSDVALRAAASAKLGSKITALAGAGDVWYAGSLDGRIWTSSDGRAHWTVSTIQVAGAVERFAVDAEQPRIAAVVGAARGAHVFRTVNGGLTWDDLTRGLADAPAHGVAMDRSAGAVYVATDSGLFLSRMDLNVLGPASAWVNVSGGLPGNAGIADVRLDAAGRQLTVAVDGYGVFMTRAPHVASAARVVNAADLSTRAAAPGGLVSAEGMAVDLAVANGRQFPVLARSAAGSQIQVPFGTEPAELILELNQSLRVGLTVKAVAPAIFVDREGAPLLLDADTGMMRDAAQPVEARGVVQLLVTGLGRVLPEWPTGTPAPLVNVPVVVAEVRAYLNGAAVEVTRATLAPGYVGMYLVEIRMPGLFDSGLAELYLEAGGELSNRVRIAVSY